jgi:Co/Zn/Cd efflux system component
LAAITKPSNTNRQCNPLILLDCLFACEEESVGVSCCHGHIKHETNIRYRRVLWAALAINLGMFFFETGAGLTAHSVALRADALDFLTDGANCAISLSLLLASLRVRAMAALAKAGTMVIFGLWLLIATAWHLASGTLPEAPVMSAVGVAALIANGTILALLTAYRYQDCNIRSVWICTRNDALGNFAVLLAAAGVFGTGRGWPDGLVAAFMASLALWGAWQIVLNAAPELRFVPSAAHP